MTLQAEMICGQTVPERRAPDQVMTLSRLGSFFPHRLSFMRSFLRRVAGENAEMTAPVCALDRDGYGHMVLSLPVSGRLYSLIAFSRPLDDADRTDRVIATAWDASFCLFDGLPDADDIDTLSSSHPCARKTVRASVSISARVIAVVCGDVIYHTPLFRKSGQAILFILAAFVSHYQPAPPQRPSYGMPHWPVHRSDAPASPAPARPSALSHCAAS